jgi:predicted ATPase
VAATPFVGREVELAELAERLARADVRLITLVGPGGIGKTRLALQTAMGHQTVFADGVAFVALAGVTAPHLIVPAMADALGIAITANTGPDAQLFAALHTREMLLVLDNVEQLLAGIDVMAELLAQAPGIKLLVTSRERLNLQEEWVFDLHGLPVPRSDPARGEDLEENASAALFLLHARRTRSDFTLTPADAAALRRICRLVEGMPLALELAASWVRLLSCPEIADEIARSLDFLSAARRNAPDRHRSIRAIFAHSWALLTPLEQQTLARLAVFRGGFDREAAEQVADADLPLLSALVDKSLVRRAPSHRYELHELIRQFAWEKLQACGELAHIQHLHLVHFLALAESAEPQLNERDQVKWLRRLDLEADNLRAAFDAVWALADYGRGMRLAAALWRYWLIHGALAEGRRHVEALLAYRDQVTPAVLTRFLYAAGSIAFYQQELGPAAERFEECVALARGHHNRQGMALALNRLAMVVQENQEFDRAEALYQEALALARTLGDETGITRALINLGTLAYDRGDVAAATPFFVESLALARRRGDQDSIATALVNLCWSSVLAGNAAGLEYGVEALAQFREMQNLYGLAYALEGVAGACTAHDAGMAARLFGAATALRRTIQAPLSPLNQGYADRMIAPARQALGQAAFDRLFAEGAAHPLDAMLDLALAIAARPA